MDNNAQPSCSKFLLYASAWLAYILFTILAFHIFNLTTLLFSITLAMLAAWLYGYPGSIITTLLCIPYHYLILYYHSSDPLLHMEEYDAFSLTTHIFGATTQLLVSGSVAMLRSTKQKIDAINIELEERVAAQTDELKRLQQHIVQSHETARILISNTLLHDISGKLADLCGKCQTLFTSLTKAEGSAANHVHKLNELIKHCIELVENLDFVDSALSDGPMNYAEAVAKVVSHYTETASVNFELHLHTQYRTIPAHIQHELYRITQEAITNAVRHGMASQILVELEIEEDIYRLTVVNNGHPLPFTVKRGMGLQLIQRRLDQIDGTIEISRYNEDKTRLTCTIERKA